MILPGAAKRFVLQDDRRTLPGQRPVCRPSRYSTWPLTMTSRDALGLAIQARAARRQILHRRGPQRRIDLRFVENHDVGRRAGAQPAAVLEAEEVRRLRRDALDRALQRKGALLAHPVTEQIGGIAAIRTACPDARRRRTDRSSCANRRSTSASAAGSVLARGTTNLTWRLSSTARSKNTSFGILARAPARSRRPCLPSYCLSAGFSTETTITLRARSAHLRPSFSSSLNAAAKAGVGVDRHLLLERRVEQRFRRRASR